MKIIKLIVVVIICCLSTICYAKDPLNNVTDSRIEKDFLNPERMNIYDKDYQKKGYIERDFLNKDRLIIYDKDHQRTGTIERNFLNKNRWDIKEE